MYFYILYIIMNKTILSRFGIEYNCFQIILKNYIDNLYFSLGIIAKLNSLNYFV